MKSVRILALASLAALGSLRLLAQTTEPVPTVIESDGLGEMISNDKETVITFHDNVRANGTGIKLTCDVLKVVVARTGDASATIGKIEKFRSMLATGNVRIIQIDREAACGRAEVLPEQDKIILSEQPVIVFHAEGARQSGKTITMYKGERRIEIEDPVSTLPPIKDFSVEKNNKPAAKPANTTTPAPAPAPAKDSSAEKTSPSPAPAPPAETPKQP